MDTELELYHKILLLELRPWTNREVTEAKFKEMLQKVKPQHFVFQPIYEVDFPKPLTAKRKYYHAIIENEAIRYLNNFHQIIEGCLNDKERKYWVHTTLTKVFVPKLKEVSKIIDDNTYTLELVSSGAKSKADKNTLEEAYIIQHVKYQLIRLYMEIQETYKAFLKDDEMPEEELHQVYFTEEAPSKSLLIEAEKIKLAKPASKVEVKESTDSIRILKSDFRDPSKGVLDYNTIIKNSSRFASFEEQLFLHGYIDKDYNFYNKHGQIQELAAIYHVMINKGYFSPKDFNKNKMLKPLDYRKFLDHRYNAKTDKQFRTLGNEPEKVAEFLEANYWLENLPTS
jgi:hypothetical protein